MKKKLIYHGNSLALVISKKLLKLLNIDNRTPLEITTEGSELMVTPIRDENRKQQFSDALQQVNTKYGRALKKLAD